LGGVAANLVWARLVDRAGSKTMLTICAITATTTPLLAILLARAGWQPLVLVFFLVGATLNGRKVGFNSALLELSPPAERPTFTALNAALTVPVAFLPLLAGVLLRDWSYPLFFSVVAGFIALGAVGAHRLPVVLAQDAHGDASHNAPAPMGSSLTRDKDPLSPDDCPCTILK